MGRKITIGAAIALLSALVGVPVLGHDEAETQASPPSAAAMQQVTVSGEEICGEASCKTMLSDPRVSGTAWLEYDGEVSVSGGMVLWGTYRLQGPDGVWSGPWVGTRVRRATMDILVALEGSGAYEGWAFVGTWTDPMSGAPVAVSGIIYEGPPPAWEFPG